ncbi:hypothetical protein [Dialister sp.]|uniref:hypothetical protein n=1 Tax=Dialister sp. TaxID=1955814 RepID=UPI0025794C35|nr:hypothetical protein [Dialister sp.]
MRNKEITPDDMLDALKTIKSVCWSRWSDAENKLICNGCPFFSISHDWEGKIVREECGIQGQDSPAFWNLGDAPVIRCFFSSD